MRSMATGDIRAVVDLQCRFLEGSIVKALGPSFLSSFHHAALEHPSTRALVAVDPEGAVVGSLLGCTDVHTFNGHVKPRVLPSLLAALLSPRRWRYAPLFARSLFEAEPEPDIRAELLLLVVDASSRRQHIAERLVLTLEQAFEQDGIDRYRVAVRSQLAEAKAFYLATGFELEQELRILGGPMTYLVKVVRP